MEMLHKKVLQSFALSTKAKKRGKDLSKQKGKEVQNAILAKDIEWQAYFKELAKHIVNLSTSGHLDTITIAKVKAWIAG
jgi:hypothetical protein